MKKISIYLLLVLSLIAYTNEEFEMNIMSGGPGKDGIPAISEGVWLDEVEAGEYLADDDVVFVAKIDGQIYIYPQRILVWHEIINQKFGNEYYSITYCPLTASTIGFVNESSLGVSGKLVNSNLIMYDRGTDSYFPQILGRSIKGIREDDSLRTFQLMWSRWERVKEVFDEMLVLSKDTGFIRNYNRDPYGDYTDNKSYYQSGDAFFPLMNVDKRMKAKEVVFGIKVDDKYLAIKKSDIRKEGVINLEFNNERIVVFYHEDLDGIKAYKASLAGYELKFEKESEGYRDIEKGRLWDIWGRSNELRLSEVEGFEVFWFAWSAYYKETEVW